MSRVSIAASPRLGAPARALRAGPAGGRRAWRRAQSVTRCAGEAAADGTRRIDPRLDSAVEALPIREVLHACLDELEVRAADATRARSDALFDALDRPNPTPRDGRTPQAVSYTHLTLPTICSV